MTPKLSAVRDGERVWTQTVLEVKKGQINKAERVWF